MNSMTGEGLLMKELKSVGYWDNDPVYIQFSDLLL